MTITKKDNVTKKGVAMDSDTIIEYLTNDGASFIRVQLINDEIAITKVPMKSFDGSIIIMPQSINQIKIK